jgi:hypothetical protein
MLSVCDGIRSCPSVQEFERSPIVGNSEWTREYSERLALLDDTIVCDPSRPS